MTAPPDPDDGPLTILYCGANPVESTSNHLDLGKECNAIRAAIDGSPLRLYPDFATSPEQLLRLLKEQDPAVLHFGMHGLRGEAGTQTSRDLAPAEGAHGALVLLDERGAPAPLEVERLRRLLELTGRRPRCIVLAACHSERAAELLARDLGPVVGMRGPITDDGAIAYAGAFYRSLSRGQSYRRAHDEARVLLPAPDDSCPVLFAPAGADRACLIAAAQPRPKLRLRSWLVLAAALLLALLCTVLLAYGHGPCVGEIRLALLAQRHAARKPIASQRLRIVLMDERSHALLKTRQVGDAVLGDYGSAWRGLYARAVERLAAAGAAVIAFDVAFEAEPAPSNPIEVQGTGALARAIGEAERRGTRVVLTAMRRTHPGGPPVIASALWEALRASGRDPRCSVAHACLAEPALGPAIPLLPLVLEASGNGVPSFALSVCAYALSEGTLPSWSREAEQLFLATERARPVAFTGLELEPDVEGCLLAVEGAGAVQRLLPPFPDDLTRDSARVIPFERCVDEHEPSAALDVKGKLVLIGQRDLERDVLLRDAAPSGKELWGISAQAAALDALLAGDDELLAIVAPLPQMLWMSGVALVAFALQVWLRRARTALRIGLALGVIAADVAACALAARHGLISDPGNHALALLIAYACAGQMLRRFRITVR